MVQSLIHFKGDAAVQSNTFAKRTLSIMSIEKGEEIDVSRIASFRVCTICVFVDFCRSFHWPVSA